MSEQSAQHYLRARIVEAPAGRTAQAVVSIARAAAGYRAHIAFSGALSGSRELDGSQCESLSEAALLVVAITADPRAANEQARARVEQAQSPAAHWQLSAALRGDWGSLPQATLGPSVQVGVVLSRVQLELGFAYFWPRQQLSGPRPGTGGEIGLWNAELGVAVAVVRAAHLELGPTLTLAAGSAYGKALQLRQPRPSQHSPWAGSLLGLQVRVPFGRFAVSARAELGVCGMRPQYSIDDYGVVFRSALVFGRIGLGVAWVFL